MLEAWFNKYNLETRFDVPFRDCRATTLCRKHNGKIDIMKVPNNPLSWLGTKPRDGSWMRREDEYPDIAIYGCGYGFMKSIFELVERLFLYGYRPDGFDFVKSTESITIYDAIDNGLLPQKVNDIFSTNDDEIESFLIQEDIRNEFNRKMKALNQRIEAYYSLRTSQVEVLAMIRENNGLPFKPDNDKPYRFSTDYVKKKSSRSSQKEDG